MQNFISKSWRLFLAIICKSSQIWRPNMKREANSNSKNVFCQNQATKSGAGGGEGIGVRHIWLLCQSLETINRKLPRLIPPLVKCGGKNWMNTWMAKQSGRGRGLSDGATTSRSIWHKLVAVEAISLNRYRSHVLYILVGIKIFYNIHDFPVKLHGSYMG